MEIYIILELITGVWVHTLHSTTDSVIRLLPLFFDISLRRMDLKQQRAVHSVRIISKELAKQIQTLSTFVLLPVLCFLPRYIYVKLARSN